MPADEHHNTLPAAGGNFKEITLNLSLSGIFGTLDTRPRILIVDDERLYIDILLSLLKDDYHTLVAKNGQQALDRARSTTTPPDLILLDVLMPDQDGHEVCRAIKADNRTRDIPVVFLTIKGDVEDEEKGFELGAVDYILKPFSPPIVKARIKTHLSLKLAREALENQNEFLEERVRDRTQEIARTQEVAIFCMASLAETRDNETGNHIRRTQHYVKLLAERLRDHPRFKHALDDRLIDLLFKTAPLHDIGKVGVPDRILLKPEPLTKDEMEEMKQHTVHGRNAILKAEETLGSNSFLKLAREIAYSHHEKWDGSGYPEGLKGDEIPLSGRLMAIADVYDALISKRVYKNPFPHEHAIEVIRKGAGKHFDPDIVNALLEFADEFKAIATTFTDSKITLPCNRQE